jgi:methionyl-tRNA formyltransferase
MLRIVFMGTPQFAVPSLERISGLEFAEIIAVVTKPDEPRGRGMKLTSPPVKVVAERLGLQVYQPKRVSSPKFVAKLKVINPDVIVVVAYGQLLKPDVLEIPPKGCINLHPSLLPKYRGPAPIQRAIINGERKTGVTVMFLDEGEDTGDVIAQKCVAIRDEDTAETLYNRLSMIGAQLLVEVLRDMDRGEVKGRPQDHSQASYAPKLKKEDGHIDWSRRSDQIRDLIRGTKPWPGAYTFMESGRMLKVHEAIPSIPSKGPEIELEPGQIYISPQNELFVRTGDGWMELRSVQPEGKKSMSGTDFVNGYRIKTGDRLR